jgi:DNA invertase Pin-like site-specific DNA recombinase
MKIVAYLRVSTGGQELSNQRLAILDYAQRHHLQIDRFLEIQVSSKKSLKERGIDGLFAGMQAVYLT